MFVTGVQTCALPIWYVRNDKGEMVPFSAFCSTEWKFGSSRLERFNGLGAVNIQGAPATGFTTGQAMLAMEEIAKALPHGFGIAWNGISFQEQQAGSQTGALYTLSILIVFLCLAALYERVYSDCRDFGCTAGRYRCSRYDRRLRYEQRRVLPGRFVNDDRSGE